MERLKKKKAKVVVIIFKKKKEWINKQIMGTVVMVEIMNYC